MTVSLYTQEFTLLPFDMAIYYLVQAISGLVANEISQYCSIATQPF